ncbi:hypothetical protein BSU04_10465 [Caballeronia sordidicola]|uniref:Uncharacterized protein n=1 Tax=Caballeronia sordidicola TaxID=196367 RepID=A0A226X5G8_CABSO|nr:hypothetical protein BSU04_10465 [Caballeronia sordidicola]
MDEVNDCRRANQERMTAKARRTARKVSARGSLFRTFP